MFAETEIHFITSRVGFVELDMIQDTIGLDMNIKGGLK